jgi:DNA segregation ATPase FtsK/SpoIIIE, S-DNA-T family
MATKGTKSTPQRPTTSNGRSTPAPTARARARRELAEAVDGRTHEFAGVALIVVGGLLGLAIYFDVAGPIGSGIETVVAHLVGVGRYLVPVVMVAGGVALIKEGTSSSPFRLAIGWGAAFLAVLGIADILGEPEAWDDIDEAGGAVGRAVGGPLSSLLGDAGAALVLVGVAFFGLLLVTRTSLKTFASRTGSGAVAVALPVGRAARKVLSDLSTLNSERQPRPVDPGLARSDSSGAATPSLYDVGSEDDPIWRAPAGRKRSPKAPAVPAPPVDAALPVDGARVGDWVLPPMPLLSRTGAQTIDRAAIEARGRVLQESLQSHGVDTTLVGMTVGPTVTRYELELGVGVKVARVTNLQKDIAYALAAVDVRILAPIPGRSAIGVEVPNHQRQLVSLGDLLTSPEANEATHPLDVAIGKDIAGRSVFLDLATTPHLLIAGATGAGKSSGINCIITSLLMRTTPDQVRLILIDPKQVEMGQYQRLPHLLTQPVTNPKKAANALGWAVKEMERRYDLLSEVGFRDIGGYNAAFERGELVPDPGSTVQYEHLPYIVVVVDELNDLMMVAARDVEDSITRIAQKARAVGVHLIVATQRPSVNVITGVIKANIPARMAFSVSSLMDSRVILDQPGAEKLVGKGDMLLLSGSSVAQRIQGSWVSEEEVRKVVAHWRRQAPEVVYTSDVESAPGEPVDDLVTAGGGSAFGGDDEDEDTAMLRQAMELVVRSQLGSTSMLQRKLKVGFARAGRIMDLLEQRGVVGPSEGSKAREVLMTVEEFELLQQSEGR